MTARGVRWLTGGWVVSLTLLAAGLVPNLGAERSAQAPPQPRSPARQAAREVQKSVLIVQNTPPPDSPESEAAAAALVNLLGHFDCKVEVLEAEAYQGGEAQQHDAVIYVGLRPDANPSRRLLEDLYQSAKPVCWLGANLDQLAAQFPVESRYGFRVSASPAEQADESQPGGEEVVYHGQVLSRPPTPFTAVEVTRPASCQVLAEVGGNGGAAPYAIHSGNLWYFADPPVTTSEPNGCHLVLCDQLHQILSVSHRQTRTALVCISGVHAHTDADKLRGLINELRTQKLPFAISVIPLYRDPARSAEDPLSGNRRLVGILREAQSGGATVIAHGLTHQVFGVTGEDAEWWDVQRDIPLAGRSEVGTERRVESSVSELVKCGLYPLVWATPRGLATPADYLQIAERFSTAWERRLPSQFARAPQVFPFVIAQDSCGQRIIPDNLPLLTKDGEIEPILEQVHYYNLVPDPWVSAAVSPEASPEVVRMLIAELRAIGYNFADLRQTGNWVRVRNLAIYSTDSPRPLTSYLGRGWDATVFGPRPGSLARYEKVGRDHRETAALEPGAILLTYPTGMRPSQVFAFEGGPEAASHRLVSAIAGLAMVAGALLVIVFTFLYLMQLVTRRARA